MNISLGCFGGFDETYNPGLADPRDGGAIPPRNNKRTRHLQNALVHFPADAMGFLSTMEIG
jgi:hypothetical protein